MFSSCLYACLLSPSVLRHINIWYIYILYIDILHIHTMCFEIPVYWSDMTNLRGLTVRSHPEWHPLDGNQRLKPIAKTWGSKGSYGFASTKTIPSETSTHEMWYSHPTFWAKSISHTHGGTFVPVILHVYITATLSILRRSKVNYWWDGHSGYVPKSIHVYQYIISRIYNSPHPIPSMYGIFTYI